MYHTTYGNLYEVTGGGGRFFNNNSNKQIVPSISLKTILNIKAVQMD